MEPIQPINGEEQTSSLMGRAERQAMEEIDLTQVKHSHAVIFVFCFLAVLFGVFLLDFPLLESLPGKPGMAKPAATATASGTSEVSGQDASVLPEWMNTLFGENRRMIAWIKSTEDHMTDRSPFVRWVQPGMQNLLAATGEGGTEVMVGKDGWLFYRPSLRFLTRPSVDFTRQVLSVTRTQVAPVSGYGASVAAVSGFAEALKKRGINLVLVPVWPKMSVHPEHLGGPTYRSDQVLKPADFAAWRDAVECSGAIIFDPAESLMDAKNAHHGSSYLRTDSHWNPLAMQTCAVSLARYLYSHNLVARGHGNAAFARRKITNQGDLLRMLRLPDRTSSLRSEEVEINEVRGEKGNRWLSDRSSPVLLLGDSFSNIFSLASMGWGQDAGFAEHLGAELRMPVDAILRNGDGASATRALLARELATGKDRLLGKKVVVWEFAASQLSEGNWHSYSYSLGSSPQNDESFLDLANEDSQDVYATVAAMGDVPHPNATVYKEFVGYFALEDLQPTSGGSPIGQRAVVYGLVMKDHQWTTLAKIIRDRNNQNILAQANLLLIPCPVGFSQVSM